MHRQHCRITPIIVSFAKLIVSFAELISNSIPFSFLQFSLFLILGEKSTLEPGIEECDLVSRSEELYTELVGKKKTAKDIADSDILDMILAKVTEKRKSCKAVSRTVALWLQYLDMLDIVRGFLKAERRGNWEMHVQAVSQMLPYFAASGHNHYMQSASLYLQSIKNLNVEHPDVYKAFATGYHVVRRGDRYWACLSTDLIIEQVLMRSLKTTGGLTRGSGMTEQQRVTWLLSTPACAQTSCAMQDLVGIQCEHSNQNKDMSETRQKRDVEDTVVILKTIAGEGRNPFVHDSVLKNIITRVNAEESVDVDKARAKGEKILASMQPVNTYSFKRKDQSITLAVGSSVTIDGVKVCVDPQLLFQRLVFACNSLVNLKGVFKYEICSYPTALFDSPVTLRQPQKASLSDAVGKAL